MKGNYHTADAVPQSRARAAGTALAAQLLAARTSKPLRIPAPARPILAGDRETLRKLRAAEMAAWESVSPKTATAPVAPAPRGEPLWRSGFRKSPLTESLSLFVLAVCAGGAVVGGLADVSELLTRWTDFLQGIGNLLR